MNISVIVDKKCDDVSILFQIDRKAKNLRLTVRGIGKTIVKGSTTKYWADLQGELVHQHLLTVNILPSSISCDFAIIGKLPVLY